MKHSKILTLFIIALVTLAASCKKTTDPGPDDFYFQCKIDGSSYIPNSCANCITCSILGDTTFLLGGNAEYEALLIGVIKLDHSQIAILNYVLNANLQQKATYKNSTVTTDRFDTDATHTGLLEIISLDKTNRIIKGNFYFKAYNSYRNDSVNVTDGKFRLKYTTN